MSTRNAGAPDGRARRLASLFMGTLAATLIAPSLALAASFSVAILAGSAGDPTCPEAGFVVSSPVPIGREVACTVALGTAAAGASATFGSVGAEARGATVTGLSVPLGIQGSASFADTLTFSKTNASLSDQFPVSLNLAFGGILNAGAGAIPPSLGVASVVIRVDFITGHVLDISFNSDGDFTLLNFGGFGGTGVIAPGSAGFDSLLTTPTQLLSVGDVFFTLGLSATAGSIGINGSGTSDFSNTLEFPTGIDVFNLPPGYTVNAGDYLVNNRFVDPNAPAPPTDQVPAPATFALLGVALAGLGAWRFGRSRILASRAVSSRSSP